jgi:hypothetical protein
VQTEIRVGHLALARKHEDYFALDQAVKILGGEGANRLQQVLRTQKGLTYGASADLEALKQAGGIVAETDTRTEATGEAVRVIVDEFTRLQRERIGDAELAGAQAYMTGSFPLTIETPNDIATEVLNVIFYDLPVEEIGTFPQRVQAVTPDDIQRVARLYIRPDRLSIVLVGNASAFVPQLRQLGFNQFEVIPIQDLDLMSATRRRGARRVAEVSPPATPGGGTNPLASRVTPATAFLPRLAAAAQFRPAGDARAIAQLTRVIDRVGGLDALKKVRTFVADADTTFQMEQGAVPSTTRTYVGYPDRFRVEELVDGADVVQVFNAGEAWIEDPGGVHELPRAMRDDFAASVRRDMIAMLVAAAEGAISVRLLPEEGREGRILRVLELSGTQFPAVQLYVDAEGTIVSQAYMVPGPGGRPARAEEVFSDYRRVDGILVPFKADLLRDNRVMVTRALKSVALNDPLDDRLFVRP